MAYYVDRTRNGLRQRANGIITENITVTSISSNSLITDQTVYFALVGLLKNDVITNIHYHLSTVSITTTSFFVGVYDTAGNRLALSNDLTTLNDATIGIKTAALSAAYTVPQDGGYYFALLSVGVTPPTLIRGNGTSGAMGGVGSGVRNMAAQAGQTTLPVSATFSAGGLGIWMAAS